MPLNHFVTLGRSGLRVSPYCLGTMTFGEDFGWGASPEESFAMFDEYRNRGSRVVYFKNIIGLIVIQIFQRSFIAVYSIRAFTN